MVKLYDLIATHADLGNLEQKALGLDRHAVGVTRSGKLYKYESRTRHAIEITKEEAASILNCSTDEIELIISSKGKYLLKSIVEAEEKAAENVLTPAEVNTPASKENIITADTENEYDEEDDEAEEAYALREAVEDVAASIEDATSELNENADANSEKILVVLTEIRDLLVKLVDATVLD